MRLLGQHGNHFGCVLTQASLFQHCGVAAGAISRAMVDIDSMHLSSLSCIALVDKRGKLWKL